MKTISNRTFAYIVLSVAAFLFACIASCHAQTARIDTPADRTYTEIEALQLPFLQDKEITRLYIKNTGFSPINGLKFRYDLMYKNYRDDSTVYYLPVNGVGSGECSITVTPTTTIAQITRNVFLYIQAAILSGIIFK